MTVNGRFPPHAPQHYRVLPRGPMNGTNRPKSDTRHGFSFERLGCRPQRLVSRDLHTACILQAAHRIALSNIIWPLKLACGYHIVDVQDLACPMNL